jgi:hypothetical protein
VYRCTKLYYFSQSSGLSNLVISNIFLSISLKFYGVNLEILILSVRKVVPTLNSRSVEIHLSMAGAKQLVTLGFILVPAGAVRPAVVCSGHYIALHLSACRGGLQASGRGGRASRSQRY